jgi:hypothetical protein
VAAAARAGGAGGQAGRQRVLIRNAPHGALAAGRAVTCHQAHGEIIVAQMTGALLLFLFWHRASARVYSATRPAALYPRVGCSLVHGFSTTSDFTRLLTDAILRRGRGLDPQRPAQSHLLPADIKFMTSLTR